MSYSEFSIEERATFHVSLAQGMSMRQIARLLERFSSTISRELKRNQEPGGRYGVHHAQRHRKARRVGCLPQPILVPGSERFELILHMLRQRLLPEQIAGKLKRMTIPSLIDAYVCRETTYNAIYALPVGELRKELIHCLRQGKSIRKPRKGKVI